MSDKKRNTQSIRPLYSYLAKVILENMFFWSYSIIKFSKKINLFLINYIANLLTKFSLFAN